MSIRFEDVVEAHGGMVRRIASVYERQPDLIDDLVQEVWVAICRSIPRLQDEGNLKAYVARIAQNVCVTHVRQAVAAGRRMQGPLPDGLCDVRAVGPDQAAAEALERARLLEAVRALPEGLKLAVSFYLEGMTVQEIALALGITENNASVRLHRAKTLLMGSLQ